MRFSTLLNYHLTDWWWNVDFSLLDELIQDFVTAICHGNRWMWTRINYHPRHPVTCEQKLRNYWTELFWRFYLFFEVLFVSIYLDVLWSHSEVLSNKFDNSSKQTEVVTERNFCQLLLENFSNLKIEILPQLISSWKVRWIIRL